MRDGVVVANNLISEVKMTDIVEQMIGHKVIETKFDSATDKEEKVLTVKNLNRGKYVRNVSFDLYKGEILGLWGLLGSGRTEIIRAMFQLDRADSGTISLYDEVGNQRTVPGRILLKQCGYVTENRHEDGLFPRMPIYMNLDMATLKDFTSNIGLLNSGKEKEITRDYIKKLSIKAPNVETKSAQLSGGNQQKLIMARWIYKNPRLFVVDEPTRGVDVNAKEEIHNLLFELARQGNSVILISSEIEEIMNMSSRVLVINNGAIVAELSADEIIENKLMTLCVSDKESAL
jgi:ribose transport system ATP-binding protein